MYLVYEVVDAECMEAKINEDDMRLFSFFKNAMDYAERRRKSLIDDGLIDFYDEFNGWSRQNMSCTLYYKSPINIVGEPKEYVEIHIIQLDVDKHNDIDN